MKTLKWIMTVVAVTVVAVVGTGAAPAQAHNVLAFTANGCLLNAHSNVIGALDGNAGTCNGDNFWAGRVSDNHATSDGNCVTAILDGVRMADSCNASGASFTFLDPQGNRSAFTRLCWANLGLCLQGPNVNF